MNTLGERLSYVRKKNGHTNVSCGSDRSVPVTFLNKPVDKNGIIS